LNTDKDIISIAPTDIDVDDPVESFSEVESRESIVPVSQHGVRIDKAMAEAVPEFSRSYLQQLIELGGVKVNGRSIVKSSAKVKSGDVMTVELRPTPQSQAFKAETIPLEVVFQDAELLVINKPAGLVVHPAPGNWSGTLLNALLAHDPSSAFLPRAGIVHRLDKDTSGLMVVARSRQAMDALVSSIAAREVSRQYLAVGLRGWTQAAKITVEASIGRDPRNRLKMAVVNLLQHPGKTARTDITLLDTTTSLCLVKCALHTGRTHQIRLHMAHIGHPLVGDKSYGGETVHDMQRQALHAYKLAFTHPITGALLDFETDPPSDFARLIASSCLSYNQTSIA
jgi:23S rRNA pseudouridine1911/1915/1917 synthase